MSDEVQQIKDKIDVAELVGEYVQLKPAGVNKKGLCPFHHEKSPSFMVSSERQSWHCFGCAKGGDIFTFLEEIEGMEFKEALKYLATRAGVQLTNFRSEVDGSQKNRMKDICKEASYFFHNFLIKMPTSKPAMDYLLNRGLKMETIEEWQIGYIPDQWELLTQYLLKKGFGVEDLVLAGITIKKDGANSKSNQGFYDRFRGRIMFPIWNVHDEVVGFTGRILVEKENSGGKYVNSPQTMIFDKSRLIYGLNKAKKEIKNKDLIVMVEGQMDVIACHQAGMKNVVASSGTALTEEQVKLLKRYSANINMAFDADEAGQNAAKRGIAIALAEGMAVKVIRIADGQGKDPDECLKKDPKIWFKAVDEAEEIMDWYLQKVLKNRDTKNPKEKQAIVNEFLQEVSLIPYAVERDHWLNILSDKIGVDVSVLREDIPKIKDLRLALRDSKGSKIKSQPVVSIVNKPVKKEKGRLELLIERLLTLWLKFPALVMEKVGEVEMLIYKFGDYGTLYEAIKKEYTNNDAPDIEKLRQLVSQGEEENLIDILILQGEWEFSSITADNAKKEIDYIIQSIKTEWLKKRRHELQYEMERAEKEGDRDKINELMEEFRKL